MPSKQKFLIFDGNALLHRAWHALPPLTTQTGEVINAAYGFAMIFLKALKDFKPDYMAVAWDRKEATFRHEMFTDYKAQRVRQPDEFYAQIGRVKEFLELFNVPSYELKGYEADDVIGTLTRLVDDENIVKIIVTGDNDALQLVKNDVEVCAPGRGISDTVIYAPEGVRSKYGFGPEALVDYKALRGDPSDNIPGVAGIGDKTAKELIIKYKDLAGVYRAAKDEKAEMKPRTRKLLLEQEKEALMSQKLARIITDAPVDDFNLKNCQLRAWDLQPVVDFCQKMEFRSLMNRIPKFWGKDGGGDGAQMRGAVSQGVSSKQGSLLGGRDAAGGGNNSSVTGVSGMDGESGLGAVENKPDKDGRVRKAVADIGVEIGDEHYVFVSTPAQFEKFLTELKKQKAWVLDTETTSLNTFEARLLGISFCWQDKHAFYVEAKPEFMKVLVPILADPKIDKYGHNLKYDVEVLTNSGYPVAGLKFDTMLAAYLLNPGSRPLGLDSLVFDIFGYQMQPISELIGARGKNQMTMDQVPPEKVAWYSCEDADLTWRLKGELEGQLVGQRALQELFDDLEMPLMEVLREMETAGILLDKDVLKKIGQGCKARLTKLEQKIYKLAGEEFNIASPKQLKVILFDNLKIDTKGIKHKKTGISTAAPELEKLRGRHEIIEPIFEYRELSKLLSTYILALPKLVQKHSGRIHTSFNQTVTTTGRLSSSNPNLQNIPVRTEMGKEIRQAFVARPGFVLLSADYSQIELRVVASLAKDSKMLAAFKKGADIHTLTAAEINDVAVKDVTPEMRRAAKATNFGVIYGIGARGLAQNAGISQEKAAEFIERYFELYSDVKDFMEETLRLVYENGYVETMMGRRRYLPEINSRVPMVKRAAERAAINMPVQGTAADIIKLAMLKVAELCRKYDSGAAKGASDGAPARLLLQVHDELVLEVKKNKLDEIAPLVRRAMEGAYKLEAPLKADLKVGKNWGEMTKLEK